MRYFGLYAALLLTGCFGQRVPQTVATPATVQKDDPDAVRVAIPDSQGHSVVLDRNANRVWRRDAAGRAAWSVALGDDRGYVRPPHLLADTARVYVTHSDGVTALDAATGAVAWHSPGPSDRMCLSGELLLATECGVSDRITKNGRWMVARSTATGHEVFRVRLPTDSFDPLPIEGVAGLFLVQALNGPSDPAVALLIDRIGRVRHRFDRAVIAVARRAEGYLVLTSRDVVLLSEAGPVKWSVAFEKDEWFADGGLIELSDRDVVAFRYCPGADSGVRVMRLDAVRGDKAWEAYCGPLGVTHSGYNHAAEVVETPGRLTVTSRGDGGTFVEVLDASTGRQASRTTGRDTTK